MKFAIVTLFTLALALGVPASIVPWGGVVTQVAGGPLAHTSVVSPGWPWHAPVVVGHPPASVHAAISLPGAIPTALHASAVAGHIPAVIPAVHGVHGVHGIHGVHGVHDIHGVHAALPVVVAGHAGYVAKTRGAVHTAPLAGHLNSVANVNVAPAPGTI